MFNMHFDENQTDWDQHLLHVIYNMSCRPIGPVYNRLQAILPISSRQRSYLAFDVMFGRTPEVPRQCRNRLLTSEMYSSLRSNW